MDDDINKELHSMSEFQKEMRQWRQQMREEAQLFQQEMRGNADRMVDTMNKLFGELTEDVIDTRDTLKSIGKRLANVEQKVTEFVDFDKRLRVLEDIVLKKAS